MTRVIDIAAYIYQRYMSETGTRIDEMKLHKLLYFAQRESLVQKGEPLFPESFQAWRYGPVMPEIREAYRTGILDTAQFAREDIASYQDVLDTVFSIYADKDSWSLSALTHGEYSWQKARTGIPQDAQSTAIIYLEDIARDAERIKIRRFLHKSYKSIRAVD